MSIWSTLSSRISLTKVDADVLRLVPDDVVGDLLTFTWPGRDTTPA